MHKACSLRSTFLYRQHLDSNFMFVFMNIKNWTITGCVETEWSRCAEKTWLATWVFRAIAHECEHCQCMFMFYHRVFSTHKYFVLSTTFHAIILLDWNKNNKPWNPFKRLIKFVITNFATRVIFCNTNLNNNKFVEIFNWNVCSFVCKNNCIYFVFVFSKLNRKWYEIPYHRNDNWEAICFSVIISYILIISICHNLIYNKLYIL